MKFQILFSRKNSKNIISLSSAEFAHSMVSGNIMIIFISDSLPAIIGGVVGGIAVIIIAAVIVYVVYKKTKWNKTRVNIPHSPTTPDLNARSMYHIPPPPYSSLSFTPPPPMKELYPDTKKWTENELKMAHPDKAPRFVASNNFPFRRVELTSYITQEGIQDFLSSRLSFIISVCLTHLWRVDSSTSTLWTRHKIIPILFWPP